MESFRLIFKVTPITIRTVFKTNKQTKNIPSIYRAIVSSFTSIYSSCVICFQVLSKKIIKDNDISAAVIFLKNA